MTTTTVLRIILWVVEILLMLGAVYFIVRLCVIIWSMNPWYKGDIPFVPVRSREAQRAIRMLKIKKGDQVVDLGSGDGKFVTYCAQRTPATVTGIEINRMLVWISRLSALFTPKKKGRIKWICKSYYDVDLSQFNKVYMFNLPNKMGKLVRKLGKELRKGSLLLSVMFPIKSKEFKLMEKKGQKGYELFLYVKK